MIFVVAMCRTRVIFLFKRYFCADSCCITCCRGHKDFIELPATELATIDTLKERAEREETEGASLLDRVADTHAATREISKSLFNVRSRPSGEEEEGGASVKAETPLMRVGNFLKASSLASLHNWGWRRETSV